MQELKGCKRKPRRTLSSKMTNLQAAKRKACKIYLPPLYSIKDKFPPVYTQRYGNCTSNAALGCDDMIYHGSGAWIPSTTFTYFNQKRKEKPMEDDGSSIEMALKMIKRYGACNSTVWANDMPYDQKPSDEAYADGLKGKEIKRWYELKNLTQIKQALVSGYPVAAAMSWAFKGYSSNYILINPTKREIDRAAGHAVVIVGYDDNRKLVEIRNSWSSEWANNGYAYISYSALKMCIWWDDTYAVTR